MSKIETSYRTLSVTPLLIDALNGVPLPSFFIDKIARPPEPWDLLMFFSEYEKEPEELILADDTPMERFIEGFLYSALLIVESGFPVILDMTKCKDFAMVEIAATTYAMMCSYYYYNEQWAEVVANHVHPCGLMTIKLSHEHSLMYFSAMAVLTSFKDFLLAQIERGHQPAVEMYQYCVNYETDMIPFSAAEVFALVSENADPDDISSVRGSQSLLNYPSWYKNSYGLLKFDRIVRGLHNLKTPVNLPSPDLYDLTEVKDAMQDIFDGFKWLVMSAENVLPPESFKALQKMIKEQARLLLEE